MADSSAFSRPEGGWRFKFGGIKTNDPPDALNPDKYPYAQNIRALSPHTVQTRPGYTFICSTADFAITDIRAYTQLDTDDFPRYLVRNSNNDVYLDTGGSIVKSLAGSSLGACMIPYRPNASPQPWMYIAVQDDYQKISPPNAVAPIIDYVYKVGIEEQHESPQICDDQYSYYDFTASDVAWVPTGTGGATSGVDHWAGANVAGAAVLADPASGPRVRYSVQVNPAFDYEVGLYVIFTVSGTPYQTVIEDVLPAVNGGGALSIDTITYYAGNTGRCVITPTAMPVGNVPSIANNTPTNSSVFGSQILSTLRRGSLIQIAGSETCFVLSVTSGPDGQACFEVETSITYAAGDALVGITAISVCDVILGVAGTPLTSVAIDSLVSVGTATYTQTFGTNPFNQLMVPVNSTPQANDYISFNLYLNTVLDTAEITLSFKLSNAGDSLYYTVTPADLIGTASLSDTPTHIPIRFPITSLIRAGNNSALTLANCIGAQLIITVTEAVGIQFGSMLVGGGGQPDVGEVGSPYFYAVRSRSSVTGAVSNPSPITRYGVSPRRQRVILSITDTVLDVQADTWDVYRFGGTVDTFRYIGSMPNSQGSVDYFTDDYFDTQALAGDVIEYDNFQPWPTIGLPFNLIAGTNPAGVTTYINVNGTSVFVVFYAGLAFDNPVPDTILRWLPGTLMTIGGQTAYTLRNRPVNITLLFPPTAYYYAYRFDLVENAGAILPARLSIIEPNVANQHLPYVWGPDSTGTVFSCGDPLRAGSLYYSKSNNPDSAPDTYNQEITPPSEPLLGGEVIDGLALVASSNRWFALYPQFQTATRFQVVEKPVGRGLAAPYGHCTDGRRVYFWAKDGIWTTDGSSLTDADLFNIFPHDGATGQDITYATSTVFAPDYKRAGTFRLSYVNGYLYADYQDSSGIYRTLVCDLTDPSNPAWSVDVYGSNACVHYSVEQQEGTVLTNDTLYPLLILGDVDGNVYRQTRNTNDNTSPIQCIVSTFEYNGGDLRSDQLFNDVFVDLLPVSAVSVQQITDGTPGVSKSFGPSASRISSNVPVGIELKYLGIRLTWTDDFDTQSQPSVLFAWQPMYEGVPISVFIWKNQSVAFGLNGYFHIRQINFAYRATAEVTLTITMQDGTSPAPILLPSTSGVYKKTMFPLTYNKGMSVVFSATCTEEWTPYLSDTEIYIGDWGREDSYKIAHDIDAPRGIKS